MHNKTNTTAYKITSML